MELLTAAWPNLSNIPVDAEADAEMDWVIRLVSQVRAVRSEMNVPAGAKVAMHLRGANGISGRRLQVHTDSIQRMARLEPVALQANNVAVPVGSAQIVHDEAVIVLPLAGIIDIDAEKTRLRKELDKIAADISGIERKLANADFVARAPEQVVAEQHERKGALASTQVRLTEALRRIGA
jgi:valyl-tRNA synthetase